MRSTKILGHAAQAIVEGALIALIIVGLVAGTALAGKGGGGRPGGSGGTTSGSLSVPNGTFAGLTTATASAADIWVHATCSQGGVVVFEQWIKSDDARHAVLTLGPTPMWQSGSASCWAEEGTWSRSRFRQSGSTTFSVTG